MGRIRFETAADVFEAFPALAEEIATAPTGDDPLRFLRQLAAGETPLEALSFGACVLARRDTVILLCRMLRRLAHEAGLGTPGGGADRCLLATEAWAREPGESLRLEAMASAEAGDPRMATTWAARAAGWSGGNLLPGTEHGVVPAPAHLTSRAARACLLLALGHLAPARHQWWIETCVAECTRLATHDTV